MALASVSRVSCACVGVARRTMTVLATSRFLLHSAVLSASGPTPSSAAASTVSSVTATS